MKQFVSRPPERPSPARDAIVEALKDGPLKVGEIAKRTGIHKGVISGVLHHNKKMFYKEPHYGGAWSLDTNPIE